MSKSQANTARHSLAAMMLHNEKLPSVAATKMLVRAGFLITNGANRPHVKLGMNLSQVDVLATLARSEAGLNCSEIADATLITKGGISGILTGSKPADWCSAYLRAMTVAASAFN